MSTHSRRAVALVATVMAILAATPAAAQYFGRNKVQYKELAFRILQTEHFDIYFYPQERAGVEIGARLAERAYARLSRLFQHELRGRQPLVLYASHPDFEQTNVIQGEIGEGTGGVTEPLRRRIALPLGGPLADSDHVITHELVHAFQFDMTTRPNMAPGQSGLHDLPLWFVEGMAEYFSLGPIDPNTAMWVRDAVREGQLPAIDELDDPRHFPYRWGQAFWAYVGGRWGDAVIQQMLRVAGAAGDVDVAIEKVLGLETKELSDQWRAATGDAYRPVIAAAASNEPAARLVIKGDPFASSVNVGPAVSPDGRWIAFLSSRGFFSIDLYIADAATGRIVRKLTSTATSAHFSSLQFIYSAGAWDAASRRLAIAAVRSGRPAIAIFDVETGRLERELPVPAVDEIFNPTWAPDGHALCFTGMTQGLTDLFTYNVETAALRRLTNDAYAELQPAWSPDGRRIAFATDRFSTRLGSLAIGPYGLAIVDPDGRSIEAVRGVDDGQSINPQWSPAGDALYFVSDRSGIANVYRVRLARGDLTQLTNVATGVTGITGSSPSMSVASQSGVVSFSVYRQGTYDIFVADRAGQGVAPKPIVADAAVLPPSGRRPSAVAALLPDPALGLPEPATYPEIEYAPKLSLEAVGQPAIAIGASRFGAAFGGALSLSFADMLGAHTLTTTVQFGSGITGSFSAKDTAAQIGYLNQARRWNWGIVAGQVPYVSGGFDIALGTSNGELVQIDRAFVYRQTERSVSGLAIYPFSHTRRLEFTGGVTRISFDEIVQTTVSSIPSGFVLESDTVETSLTPPLTIATSAAAFVEDTASDGPTSPVLGRRYRVEAAPAFGTIRFTSVLADYRRYFMPAPFYTFAFRAIHYGRYGAGGEDPRLYPLYLGYPTLVRGYDVNSFDASECAPTATSECPAFDRLVGSRLLVGNVEFRFPLLRPFGVSRRMYGPLPLELAVFADSGVAWDRRERPSLVGGARGGVSSVGVTLRANLAGFAVGQLDFARPLQRPDQGWVIQFNLTPGF